MLAIAGLASPTPADGRRQLLRNRRNRSPAFARCLLNSPGPASRARGIHGLAVAPDEALLTALLEGDEATALGRAGELAAAGEAEGGLIYGTTKRALARWSAGTPRPPTGRGVHSLNAVAPGVVLTPMTADLTATEDERKQLAGMVPMPLGGFSNRGRSPTCSPGWAARRTRTSAGRCLHRRWIDAVIRGDSTW
ncbi:MAG: hypothetical protein WDM88_07305 [Galbitalea sp.]